MRVSNNQNTSSPPRFQLGSSHPFPVLCHDKAAEWVAVAWPRVQEVTGCLAHEVIDGPDHFRERKYAVTHHSS